MKATKINKTVSKAHHKPGDRRKELKAKQQEDFSKVNNNEAFPQLGSSSANKNTITKHNNRHHAKNKNKFKKKEEEEMDNKHFRKDDSAPINNEAEKNEQDENPKSDFTKSPPKPSQPPNFSNNSPIQMPPPMYPGMAGSVPVNINNQGVPMPMMGIMMMPTHNMQMPSNVPMTSNMQMHPQPFMMHPHMNAQNMMPPPEGVAKTEEGEGSAHKPAEVEEKDKK